MRSTSASSLSPFLRNLPSAAPTPSGVPVAITSPGSSVKPCESTAMHSSTGKIILEVWLDWRVSPFTRIAMASVCGSGISSAGTSTGPLGQNVSGGLPLNPWPGSFCRSRAVTSVAMGQPKTWSHAVALEERLAVGERLARGAEPVGAAADQLEHRLGKAAAAVADGAALAREVGGQCAEVEDGLADQRAHARLRRALAVGDQMHVSAPSAARRERVPVSSTR